MQLLPITLFRANHCESSGMWLLAIWKRVRLKMKTKAYHRSPNSHMNEIYQEAL